MTMTPEEIQTHLNAIKQTVPTLQGWCTPEKAEAMARLIIETRPSVVVEIGVFGGRSLLPQAMALRVVNSGKAFGIDPWSREACLEGKNDKANDDWWASINLDGVRHGCIAAIAAHNLQHWCALIHAHSAAVCDCFSRIDVLHIDGTHSELASVRDVANYMPKVPAGGFIWMDDTDWPTTQKAVGMVTEACDEVKAVGNCRLYRKR